jgi:uncharacterized protein YbjQ (UPF0145 family)
MFNFMLLEINAQAIKIEILKQSGYSSNIKKYSAFFGGRATMYYLDNKFDTAKAHFIASIKGTSEKKWPTIEEVYNKVVNQANKLGANAVIPKKVVLSDSIVFELDFYYASDTALEINEILKEKNVVYVFGNLTEGMNKKSVMVNNNTEEIEAGYFKKYILSKTATVFYRSTGLAWSDFTFIAKNEQAYIISIAGLGNVARRNSIIGSTQPMSFVERDLGLILLKGLKQQQ